MTEITYGLAQRMALITLAALGGEAPNATLAGTYGIKLDPKQRDKLNTDSLVKSTKVSGRVSHRLTDLGWGWVEQEMDAAKPPRSGTPGGALFALLHGLQPAVRRAGGLRALLSDDTEMDEDLAPDARTAAPAEDLPARIRAAYRALTDRPGAWVALKDLRPRLTGATKADVDAALKAMFFEKDINLTLREDRSRLTSEDHAAALRLDEDDMHMLSME